MRRDEKFAVGDHVHLDIDLAAGTIVVQAGPTGTAVVQVDASNADSYDITQFGETISVHPGSRGGRGRSARIVVEAPVGSDVSVKGASVDIALRGALGALRMRSASGDVAADDLVRAEVWMSSGDVRIGMIRSDANFTTTSGDIVVRSVGGRLDATLASGDLRSESVGGDATVGTASGDIQIGRCDGSAISMRTLSGDIRLGLPSGIRVDPDISTMSGRVHLPDAPRAAAGSTGERRQVRVKLRTVSGDIRIDRAG